MQVPINMRAFKDER